MTPYDEGNDAYEEGKVAEDNPYPYLEWQHLSWLEGFDSAQEYHYNEGN